MVSCNIFDNYLSIAIISLNIILIGAVHSELKLINVVFRHGDRTPDNNGNEMYPNDPYLNYTFYPTGFGQLTLKGKEREYRLGQFLRFRYNDFLGSLYTPKLVIGHSSEVDRTKMSLQLVLAGLFPPSIVQQWNLFLNWQPIPTSYTPLADDNIFLTILCPQSVNELNRIINSPEGQLLTAQFQDSMDSLTKLTGKKIETLKDLYHLYQTFVAEFSLELPLPEWAYDYFPYGPLFDAGVAFFNISYSTPLSRRLNAGPMIRTITDNMITVQNPTVASNTKIYLYSGHDVNVASILHAFGVYTHVPEYSDAVILELRQIGQEYYVKLVYYRGNPPTIENLKISGCDILCPFDRYLDLIEDLMPSDEEMICNKKIPS